MSHKRERGLAALKSGRLVVSPGLAKGDFQLTVSCALEDNRWLSRQLRVELIPGRVRLPAVPTSSVFQRLVSNITRGSELLLSWAVVERGTPAVLDTTNRSSSYVLRLEKHNFTTDLINATLLLVRLTWTKNITEPYLKILTRINLCNDKTRNKECKTGLKDCGKYLSNCVVELWAEVSVKADLPTVAYPKGKLRVTASPYARIAQPSDPAPSSKIQFQPALPELLESPFEVTATRGIVYLADWSTQALHHTADQPGTLVEWTLDKRPAGLVWLEVDVQVANNCTEWDVCSEAKSEKACVRPCRIGAGSLQRGRCEWRNNTNYVSMTKNYATCSTSLTFCPDKECDPLEQLNPAICSQDCTKHEVSLGALDRNEMGIGRGRGVCSCDVTGKCHCGVVTTEGTRVQRGEEEQSASQPLAPPKLTAGLPHPALHGDTPVCGPQCIAMIIIVVAVVIAVTTIVYVSAARICIFRKKDQSNTEYSGHALLPIGPSEIRTTTPVVEALLHHHEIDPKWEVPRSRLTVEECLGEGEFGRVLRATARDLPNNPGYLTVAVKTLKENAGSSELEDLLSEYQLLKEVSHPNVVKLLGACTTPGAPYYVIIEFCALGSLRAYLRRHRNIKNNNDNLSFSNNEEITPRDILSFAWQISKGMSYLTEIKLVHRDLAARNILLATGKVCKISDFGLTRDVYEDDTYLKKSRGRVPVKWMALESLSDHIYTSKSDVWSFGVVLWELVTLGSSPYPGVAVQNLYHLLKNGYRMQKPSNCSDQLYDIMKECWSANPPERPSFNLLVEKFEKMLEDGADYLDCNVNMVSNPSYFNEIQRRTQPGTNELDIKFQMDFEEEEDPVVNSLKYENDSVNKNTTYDVPKPVTSIILSDLLTKEEQR